MLNCTKQVPSRHQGRCRTVTLKALAVSFQGWTVERRTTLQLRHTVKAALARPVVSYPSKQVVQRLHLFKHFNVLYKFH